MANSYKEVRVRYNGGKPECDPEWVPCFWTKPGEEDIRWTFEDFPPDIVSVVVEFMGFVPSKYRRVQPAPTVPGFLARPPFRGIGAERNDKGLSRVFTFGNRQEQGYFCYTLRFFGKDGGEMCCCDPGGTSDPDPPESQHP